MKDAFKGNLINESNKESNAAKGVNIAIEFNE